MSTATTLGLAPQHRAALTSSYGNNPPGFDPGQAGLANSSGNGKYIGRPIIADATGQGGNPARDASRSPKDFPNGLEPIARAAARYQTVTETQSPAAAENKVSQSRQK